MAQSNLSKFAVVVVTYNRAKSLKRLLSSLNNAEYNHNQTLVISIDGGGSQEVLDLVSEFKWNHGDKEVIQHVNNIGLRKHILSCGDLTNKYGAVLILEDDLFVSPFYAKTTENLISYYKDCEDIAGFSLYSYSYNEFAKMPFTPKCSEYSAYFSQVASSWGQVWTKRQWNDFKSWYDKCATSGVTVNDNLPLEVIGWPETSWKKYYQKYIVQTKKYFVYPYNSLVTNFSDAGSHFTISMQQIQVPLAGFDCDSNYCELRGAKVIYDSYFEPVPSMWESFLPEKYKGLVECDLYGTKLNRPITAEYLLSIHKSNIPELTFSSSLVPIIDNIIYCVSGKDVVLAKRESFYSLSSLDLAYFKISRFLTPSVPNLILFSIKYLTIRLKNYTRKKIRRYL